MIRYLIFLIIMFIFSSCENKEDNNKKLLKDFLDSTFIENTENYKLDETFPFSKASKIELLSYPSRHYWDGKSGNDLFSSKGIIQNGKLNLDTSFIKERIELDQHFQKELFNILYNSNDKIAEIAACYEPRHLILLYDQNDFIIAHIEICFSCLQTSTSNNIKFNAFGSTKMNVLKLFFQKNGIKYFEENEDDIY